MTERTRANVTTQTPLGDLGRRLAARRAQLGLTRGEVAARAGMAAAYLGYLEEHPGGAPGTGPLIKLAEALETTVTELTGGAVDVPPGPGRAGREPRFTELTPAECRSLLGTHGVGRLAVSTGTGPVIVPVNYGVVDDAIAFRTALGATPSLAAGQEVAFEVDRIDDAFSQGWSVLVRGHARTVTDEREQRRLTEQAYSAPWAGGTRDLWVRVEPRTVTGRRITA
ncbi:DNA-binding protein [Streptomyces fodineus]|uniref:DNA-binding protein n=1 Tax=Streptomyces fodineus TaxID=1904616 RepID=A0A1D7YKR1_9ACTN|nr:pyridoxamine 5'-phosphate oxidase family protein [Streptomyces fodineus]AOR36175.1 DNA-binding protein [Streptomyces fodineus]